MITATVPSVRNAPFLPFVLSLSKHRPSFVQEERQPFDKLRANGVVFQELLA